MPSYFNIFECDRNILDRLDVTHEQSCMANPIENYYNTLLNTLVDDNNLKGAPLPNDKLQQAVSKVIEETEAEFEHNINEITCDTSFQSP